MDEQKTSYINIGDETHNVGNIFNELSGELGDLDFDMDGQGKKEEKKKDRLSIIHTISWQVFIIAAILVAIISLDLFLRNQDDNSLITSLPICSYISWGVENYENTDCKTLSMIFANAMEKKDAMEKTLVLNLTIIVPRKLQSIDVLSSPKVRFIQEHTWDSRTSIIDAMNRFMEIKNRTAYKWEDIDCRSITMDEQGEMNISCEVYGWVLLSPTRSTSTHTSREVALDFLSRLSDERGGFQLLNTPKTLSIGQYSSGDGGIKSVFSTVTSLDIKLRYLSTNKM